VVDLWWRDLALVSNELGNLFVKCISCYRFLLFNHVSEFTLVELRVVVRFCALHSNEGIYEIFVSHDGLFVPSLELVHSDRLLELFSDDSISLQDHDEFTLEQDL
jgi:hypothetical protein